MRLRCFKRLLMAELFVPLAPTASPTPPEYEPFTSMVPLGPNSVTLSPAANSRLASGFRSNPGETDEVVDAVTTMSAAFAAGAAVNANAAQNRIWCSFMDLLFLKRNDFAALSIIVTSGIKRNQCVIRMAAGERGETLC